MKRLLHINNKQMEIFHEGESGQAILILTGMACSFEEWIGITEVLSAKNQVVMFHRPGLGESEIGSEERTTAQTVIEMNCLLSKLKISDPIILVGHSYGGLCAQHFAKLHSEKIKALVLVDSTSEDLEMLDTLDLPILNENASDDDWIEICSRYANQTEEELKKIVSSSLTHQQKKLPVAVQQNLVEFQQKPNLYKAMKSEVENWKMDAKTIKELGNFGNKSLHVIGRDKNHMVKIGIQEGLPEEELTLLEETWEQLIINQAQLSGASNLIFAEHAGHAIFLDRPDLIISVINKVLQQEGKDVAGVNGSDKKS